MAESRSVNTAAKDDFVQVSAPTFELHLTVSTRIGDWDVPLHHLIDGCAATPDAVRHFEASCEALNLVPLLIHLCPIHGPTQLQTCSRIQCLTREEAQQAIAALAEQFEKQSNMRVLRRRVELDCNDAASYLTDAVVQADCGCYHEIHVKLPDSKLADKFEIEKQISELPTVTANPLLSFDIAAVGNPSKAVLTLRMKSGSAKSVGSELAVQLARSLVAECAGSGIGVSEKLDVEYCTLDTMPDLDVKTVLRCEARTREETMTRTSSASGAFKDMKNPICLGVSLEHLEAITKLPGYRAGMTTGDVCLELIRPLTETTKTSYAVYLLMESKDVSTSGVDIANVFVSHPWGCSFEKLLACIRMQCQSIPAAMTAQERLRRASSLTGMPKGGMLATRRMSAEFSGPVGPRQFVWLDIVTVNQHHTYYGDFWFETFELSVQEVGRTAVVLSPFAQPQTLSRSWCLWELFCTIKTDTPLDIIVPPDELDNFRRALLNNLDELLAILGGVDVSTAQATHAIDKQRIDAAIITSNVGFNGVNKVVTAKLRSWLAERAVEQLDQDWEVVAQDEKLLQRAHQVIWLLLEMALYATAVPLLRRTTEACQDRLGRDYALSHQCFNLLCWQLIDHAEYDEARAILSEAVQVQEAQYGLQHALTLKSSCWLTRVLHETGELDQAEALGERALASSRALPEHRELSLELAFLVGKLLADQRKLARADELLAEAVQGCEQLMPKHWIKLSAAAFRGRVLTERGRYAEAEKLLRPTLAECVTARGDKHKATLYAKAFLAQLLAVSARPDEARLLVPAGTCAEVLGMQHWLTQMSIRIAQDCMHLSLEDPLGSVPLPSLVPGLPVACMRAELDRYLGESVDTADRRLRMHVAVKVLGRRDVLVPLLEALAGTEHSKPNARSSHLHHNGFWKLVLVAGEQFSVRLHLWHAASELSAEPEVHHHRWDFASAILRGGYTHEFWKEVEDGGEQMLRYTRKHTGDHVDEKFEQRGGARLCAWFRGRMMAGDDYVLEHQQLHRTLPLGADTATLIVHGPNVSRQSTMYAREAIEVERQAVGKMKAVDYTERLLAFAKSWAGTSESQNRGPERRVGARERRGVLVLLSGKKAAGKDYCGAQLVELLQMCGVGVARHAQALNSKSMYAAEHPEVDLFRLVHDRKYKDEHRTLVTQIYQAGMASDPEFFARRSLQSINDCGAEVVVVTDFRRHEELRFFREHFRGEVVTLRVNASDAVRAARGWVPDDEAKLAATGTAAISNVLETELDDFDGWDVVLRNEGTPDEVWGCLREQCLPLMSKKLGRALDPSDAELFLGKRRGLSADAAKSQQARE